MNPRYFQASLILFAAQATGWAPAADAEEIQPRLQVQAIAYLFDCSAARAMPRQSEVGEWTGQQNFAQIHQTRRKLMAEISRACRKAGIERVQLTRQTTDDAGCTRGIATAAPARRSSWQK